MIPDSYIRKDTVLASTSKKGDYLLFQIVVDIEKKVFWQQVICDLICAFIIEIERKNCVFEIVRINSPSPAHRGKGRKKRVEIRRYIELTSRMFSNQWTWLKNCVHLFQYISTTHTSRYCVLSIQCYFLRAEIKTYIFDTASKKKRNS